MGIGDLKVILGKERIHFKLIDPAIDEHQRKRESSAQGFQYRTNKAMLSYWIIATVLLQLSVSATSPTAPILPEDYIEIIKQGFATNWFKLNGTLADKKYNDQNIQDIYSKGFRNVRLRCRADLYTPPYLMPTKNPFNHFLMDLKTVVNKSLEVGVAPIVSWIHHEAEACASDEDRRNYVQWWTLVANKLKNQDYRLSFNLFTELGTDCCTKYRDNTTCDESLRMNPNKYNQWTSEVIHAIRETGGKNADRILILASPTKTGEGLKNISQTIYYNQTYMMAEWHVYASGPNKNDGKKYWSGEGTTVNVNDENGKSGRGNVRAAIRPALNFTRSSGLRTYLGAWMPTDNTNGSLSEAEAISFGRFFARKLRDNNIPWSLNVLDRYYDTRRNEWLTGIQNIEGSHINMSRVLENIMEEM